MSNLNFIRANNITALAKSAKVSRVYVEKIVRGQRPGNSRRARLILAAAEKLNADIAAVHNALEKEVQQIDAD